MRRPLIAALAAAVLAGCGDDPGSAESSTPTPTATATETPTATPSPAVAASGPETRPIAAVLRRYAAAVRAGDARTICRDLLARTVVERVEGVGGDCARDLIGPRIEEGGPDYAIAIRSVSVDGDRAVAQITARERDGPRDSRQPLVRERDGWRLGAR
jgi:Prokaryotic membrane lipoprotein lipid attachment site